MDGSLLADAFGHHAWATLTLLDTCLTLTSEQLETGAPGTYGSILDTMRHMVASDRAYLCVVSGADLPEVDEEHADLQALRAAMAADGPAWAEFLEQDLDAAALVERRRADGTGSIAPLGIRLAQALHHGTDHRSQICTALTNLGVEPPEIDVWAFAQTSGRVVVTPATG